MNVDAEIYIKNLYHFFDTNPDQLKILIGDTSKNKFFEKIKTRVYKHVDTGEEIELTRQEMVDLIYELFTETNLLGKKVERTPFMDSDYGPICLN